MKEKMWVRAEVRKEEVRREKMLVRKVRKE